MIQSDFKYHCIILYRVIHTLDREYNNTVCNTAIRALRSCGGDFQWCYNNKSTSHERTFIFRSGSVIELNGNIKPKL